MSTTPCASCPWRVGATAEAIPGFDPDKARRLCATDERGDGFHTIMACHGSPEGEERPCVGYLYRYGWGNLAVRMMAARGAVDLGAIERDCAELDLYEDWPEALDALLDEPDDANGYDRLDLLFGGNW